MWSHKANWLYQSYKLRYSWRGLTKLKLEILVSLLLKGRIITEESRGQGQRFYFFLASSYSYSLVLKVIEVDEPE